MTFTLDTGILLAIAGLVAWLIRENFSLKIRVSRMDERIRNIFERLRMKDRKNYEDHEGAD